MRKNRNRQISTRGDDELEGDLEEMPAVVDALVGVIEVLPVLLV